MAENTNFSIVYSSSVKNAIEILIGIALNPQIALSIMNFITINSSSPWARHIFPLIVFSSVSFISVLFFSV